MKKYLIALAVLFLIISDTTFAQTITYELDYTFAEDGVLTLPSNYINHMKVQPDGKILALKSDKLNRFNTDGSPDFTFGFEGSIDIPIYDSNLAVMPDNQHIIVATCDSPDMDAIYVYDGSGNFVSEVDLLPPSCFSDIAVVSDTTIRVTNCGFDEIYEYDILNNMSSVLAGSIPDTIQRCVQLDYENDDMITSYATYISPLDTLTDTLTFYIAKQDDSSFGDNGVYSRKFPFDSFAYTRHNIWIQADGKIVYVYSINYDVTYVERLNADGTPDNTFSSVVIPNLLTSDMYSFVVNSNNEIILIGYDSDEGAVIKVISADGSQINDVTGYIFAPNADLEVYSVDINADDDVILSAGLNNESIIAKFERKIYSNLISGNVFKDDNSDCIKGADESELENWFVKIEGDYTAYARTDTNGNYSIAVDTGSYIVNALLPNYMWTGTCPADTIVELLTNNTDATVDFAAQHVGLCPFMEVDITTPFIRRCFNTYYTVQYCNNGTGEAEDAYIEVQLDPYFTFLDAQLSATDLGDNLYAFDLGDVQEGECGFFDITVYVDCDSTVLGQIHCVEAHIYPDSTCIPPDPAWDMASIMVNAQCLGDSIEFTVENIGLGDMSDSLEYMVVEEDLIWHRTNFQLESGDSLKFHKPSNGLFYRLEAEQSPGHPGNSMPSVFVEGCGLDDNGEFSTGFVNYFPLDEGDPFISIDCQENIGAYDPNDKQAFPVGYGAPHYITDSTDLEYLIRFQNTGTDTAFTVVIRDTISPHLNIETLRPGVASHDYQYDIDSSNIAVFTFENIMLPDSNVNEAASHGFIKFNIEQQRDNPIDTYIENDAAIYFDFNEPIITNTVFHTVGEDFMGIVTSIITPPEVEEAGISVNVFPNPFDEYTRFEVQGETVKELQLNVYDMMGREVLQQKAIHQQHMTMKRNNLTPGVYVFRLMDEKQQLATGKLVIK